MYIPVVQGEQVQLVTTLEGYGRVPINRANLAYDTSNAYKWNIMITQIDCGPETTSYRYDALVDATPGCFTGLKAPEGCLQYFTEPYDKISSFNFDGFSKIAPNQDYAICIRPNTDYF